MKMSKYRNRPEVARRIGLGAILVAMATGAPYGCTREFYREWANQDVSEAVFEKSRDPRWRIDVFSVEPPMLSRFADPYDQEVPPAPPDDPATEALSPVPQWADNRLLLPVEGTGYLDLLEYWRRDRLAKDAAAGHPYPAEEPEYWQRPDNGRHPVTYPRQPGMSGQPLDSPDGAPVPPETGSPFFPEPPPPVPRNRTTPPAAQPSAPSRRRAELPRRRRRPSRSQRHRNRAGLAPLQARPRDCRGRRQKSGPRPTRWSSGCRMRVRPRLPANPATSGASRIKAAQRFTGQRLPVRRPYL